MKTKIKTITIRIVSTLIILVTIQSCKKYPEGPTISLRSKTARVSNIWKVENYKINGLDFTSLVSGYTETFTKEGNYSYSWGVLDGSGKWQFQNNEREIKISGISSKSSETLYILKLEQKTFWYYYMDGNNRNEFHMIQR